MKTGLKVREGPLKTLKGLLSFDPVTHVAAAAAAAAAAASVDPFFPLLFL